VERPEAVAASAAAPEATGALAKLGAIPVERASLRAREDRLVRAARDEGASWGAIARALQQSRQWVHQRHRASCTEKAGAVLPGERPGGGRRGEGAGDGYA
jgi:hypothetical protein